MQAWYQLGCFTCSRHLLGDGGDGGGDGGDDGGGDGDGDGAVDQGTPFPLSTTPAGGSHPAGSGSADLTSALPTGDPSPPLYQLLCCSTCNRHLHLHDM